MKTILYFPNGVSAIIEHGENIAPQLLEVKEDNFTIDLIKDCESLRRTVTEFESVNTQIMTENSELRTALENIKIINNDNLATISALREELKSVYEKPAPATPTKAEKVEKTKRKKVPVPSEKANPVWSKKPCANCGHLFQPTGPRSTVCENCKAEKQSEPAE